jgi:VWFA-related protein
LIRLLRLVKLIRYGRARRKRPRLLKLRSTNINWREEYQRASAYLLDLAQKTGGRFYNGDTLSGISQAFAQIAEELRRQYSLGYYPKTAGPVGQRRKIKVRVNQPDVVVTARDSYIYSQKKTNTP